MAHVDLPTKNAIAITTLFSAVSILILLYGSLGVSGNAAVTVAILVLPLVLLSSRFRLLLPDYLFLAFLGFLLASIAANGLTTTGKEYILLIISLSAYPAFRGVGNAFNIKAFVVSTAVIVAAGTIVTIWSLFHFTGPNYKPSVLGFDDGSSQFTLSLSFLIIAITASGVHWRNGIMLLLPIAVFASAMVRHPFVGLLSSLTILSLLTSRLYQSIIIVGLIILAIGTGLLTRPDTALKLIGFVSSDANCSPQAGNSIALRKTMIIEALDLIPIAGVFGKGIGSFATVSCVKSYPHNVVLQAAVELGISAAVILVLLVGYAFSNIIKLLRLNIVARFVFGSLVFIVFESLVSGSLTNSVLLFGLTGWAVGLKDNES